MSLSVVIPVYNGERYLADAIHSVLDVVDDAAEVIVVDDGSCDRTAEIAAGFGGRVQCLRQANRGPAAARNHGLERAQGEVIGFLDADDLWTPAVASGLLPYLLAHPETDIVQGRVQEIHAPASDGPHSNESGPPPYDYVNIGSALYRKRVFAAVGGFDETMPFCEDYDWFLRAFDAHVTKVRVLDVTLLYRIHPGGTTYGKSPHDIGLAKAHKKAIGRRREGVAPAPPDFPSLLEYIGTRSPLAPLTAQPE